MSSYPVQITLPGPLYDRLRKAAEDANQPIEQVLLQRLEDALAPTLPPLPADEQAELTAMMRLSDDALWTIGREEMPTARQQRLTNLLNGNASGSLDEVEQRELAELVDGADRLMLRKAQAYALLAGRGHHVPNSADD